MTIRVAINGYGRIGRCVLRSIFEYERHNDFQVVVINDTAGIKSTAHFTQYDSTHGRFNGKVDIDHNTLIINDQRIDVKSERIPEHLPWNDYDIDILLECSGHFTQKNEAMRHVLIQMQPLSMASTIQYCVPMMSWSLMHHALPTA